MRYGAVRLDHIFGSDADPIELVAERAELLLPDLNVVVWEGDATTFEFTFVSDSVEAVFGHPASSWLKAKFWADAVLHKDDRDDAIAYCALATGQGRDHQFEYRGVCADGRTCWVYDVVKVVKGPTGFAAQLRGVMMDITAMKRAAGLKPSLRFPELVSAGD